MNRATRIKVCGLISVGVISSLALIMWPNKSNEATETKPKAALNVRVCNPQEQNWPNLLSANGSVVAWQEAIVGAELSGLQLESVLVDVGDQVKRGQVLARFVSDSIDASVEQQKANLEVARAAYYEAEANADRARILGTRNALSGQQINQYLTAERSAKARVTVESARLQSEKIRKRQTEVIAPDDGVISSRSATLGVVAQQGQELFKLVRQNRLEWRAEVIPEDMTRIQINQSVNLLLSDGRRIQGRVRVIAPTIDSQTRTALIYVDLPVDSAIKPGIFVTGEFELGESKGLTLPQSAVVFRDGLSFVFEVNRDEKVTQTQVTIGRRIGDKVEVTSGINEHTIVVAQGAGFLTDGDLVKVVSPEINSAITVVDKEGSVL